jgi:hypothetical protein
MHPPLSTLQAPLSLLCLLLVPEVAACPLGNHASQHDTTPISARDRDHYREVARQFAASLVSSNGTLVSRNIIMPGGGTVCHSLS